MTGFSIENLSYSYGSKTALNAVSFSVAPGEFCALLGPNGAGKSTLFGLMTRLIVSQEGSIKIADCDLSANPRKALASLGIVFQQPTLDLDLTVRRNLLYFAALHGIGPRAAAHRIDATLERLGMAERANERARDLNGGHRRRAEIARALMHDPKVLLLDEPTVGLDAASRSAITDHVHDLATSSGLSILWATHLTDEVRRDDRLLILDQGEARADGTARTIMGDRPLAEVFLDLTEGAQA